jgi:lysophospholipase L1-like esterase
MRATQRARSQRLLSVLRLLLLACGELGCVAVNDRREPSSAPPAPAASSGREVTADSAGRFPVLGETCANTEPGSKFDFSRVSVAGRSELSEAGLRFAWSGTALDFHFRGSEFQIELADSGQNWFGVTLDGVERPGKLSAFAGQHCYALADRLAPGEHRLRLTRLTEAAQGESLFLLASAGKSGEILAPVARPARRMEVIGDSITAAYGVEGKDPYCHFSAATENQSLSYAALLARRFDAELSTIAWSGKGVFSNRGNASDRTPLPVLWERTLPMREDSRWDFSAWLPDAVVIDLGTNDFAPQNRDKSPFPSAYRAFLVRVRAVYPKAALFCALSPMLSDRPPPGEQARTSARAGIQAAVAALKSYGDARVFYVEHALPTDAEGWGCDWHPSRVTQARMAAELAVVLAKNLGW